MSKYLQFTGKALWAKVWPDQIDRAYEDEKRGGNNVINLIVDDDMLKKFNAIGGKSKAKRIDDLKKTDGLEDYLNSKYLTFRRYERLSNGTAIEPLEVVGVDPGTAIGNLSDVTVTAEVYSYEYQGKTGYGIRLVKVEVDNLIPYVKHVAVEPGNAPPVH